jgi:hypothetical protein
MNLGNPILLMIEIPIYNHPVIGVGLLMKAGVVEIWV